VAAKPSTYVLDSFAILAYLEGEAGQPRIQDLLQGVEANEHRLYVSLINVGEVLYLTERERGLTRAQQALAAIDQLPVEIVPVSRATVLSAAHLKAHYPIAYADAFALVTAQDYNGVLVTGDPEFQVVVEAGLVTVEWLPRK
jgi:predicted nucleic acid-binding protein